MVKLRDLEARLIRFDPSQELGIRSRTVELVAEAHGVDFRCPIPEHGHHVRVYFEGSGVDPSFKPLPRWKASGTTINDLTISPSIHINPNAPPAKPGEDDGVCRWHGFVTNGEAA